MNRSIRGLLALALTGLLLSAGWAQTADDKKDKGTGEKPFQKLVNRHSEKVAGVFNKGTTNGSRCVQWEYKPGEPNQQWRVVAGSGGWSYIENANSKTFLSVKIAYANKTVRVGKRILTQKVIAGADVCISDKVAGDSSQMWKMLPVGKEKDYFRLINRATNTVLMVDGSSQKSGAKLILAADARTSKAQHWKLEKLDAD